MAEITKITTPMLPKENIGNKYKPVTDQAFDLTDPSKIHKSPEDAKIQDHSGGSVPNENMGRAALAPLFRNTVELIHVFQRMVSMLQMGISTSEVMDTPEMRQLLESLFVPSDKLLASLLEQDQASVLFKGDAFNVLRDILARFPDHQKLERAIVNLLKTYEHNVNVENSTKAILQNCYSILNFLFTRDRAQFEAYLAGLSNLLLPQQEAAPEAEEVRQGAGSGSQQAGEAQAKTESDAPQPPTPRETAVILKSNLLPLLGEIVVKYNQNETIRNTVMTVVHNIVRVDQGTPEALEQAIKELLGELRLVAKLPQGFEDMFRETILQSAKEAKHIPNEWMDRMSTIISEALRAPDLPPATFRQAEMLLFSMLQNQGSMMEILHFVLPMQMPDGSHITAELYIDPESEERARRAVDEKASSRKLFLAFESDTHGSFELAFLQTDRYIDFSMWCPAPLVREMQSLRRSVIDLMQVYGYTLGSFHVDELTAPKSIAQVFPNLLKQKVGVDVRI